MRILQAVFMIVMLSIMPSTLLAEEPARPIAIIQIDGLSCPFCVYGLEKNLKKVNGGKTVKIDMKTGKATVALKPDVQVDDQTLRKAVKKAGFTARDIIHQ